MTDPARTGPYRTVEVRWFRRGPLPEAVAAWFARLGAEVPEEVRTDRYLAPASDALGVKVRAGRIEAKRRDACLDVLRAGRAQGTVEAWAKWSFPLADATAAPEAGWVEVRKRRRQRGRRFAARACALEVGEVEAAGEAWWSVCLEAVGPTAAVRLVALAEAADLWLAADDAPALGLEAARSYPAWLMEVA
ncbi:MAG: hypothetical protein AAF845_12605 [Bacteroidota bacterium]